MTLKEATNEGLRLSGASEDIIAQTADFTDKELGVEIGGHIRSIGEKKLTEAQAVDQMVQVAVMYLSSPMCDLPIEQRHAKLAEVKAKAPGHLKLYEQKA